MIKGKMMADFYIQEINPFFPHKESKCDLILLGFGYVKNELHINLIDTDSNQHISCFFKDTFSYAVMDEGGCLLFLDKKTISMGIFKCKELGAREYFHNQLSNVCIRDGICQYLIVTQNEIISVLSLNEPEIKPFFQIP